MRQDKLSKQNVILYLCGIIPVWHSLQNPDGFEWYIPNCYYYSLSRNGNQKYHRIYKSCLRYKPLSLLR